MLINGDIYKTNMTAKGKNTYLSKINKIYKYYKLEELKNAKRK